MKTRYKIAIRVLSNIKTCKKSCKAVMSKYSNTQRICLDKILF